MTMAKLKRSKRRKNPTGSTLLTKPSRPKEQEGWKYKNRSAQQKADTKGQKILRHTNVPQDSKPKNASNKDDFCYQWLSHKM